MGCYHINLYNYPHDTLFPKSPVSLVVIHHFFDQLKINWVKKGVTKLLSWKKKEPSG